MSRTIFEFRRHSIKDGPRGDEIGPRGCALARAVGQMQLRGRKFDRYFVSAEWRTVQTMAAFAEGAGDFAMKHAPLPADIYLDWPEIWDLWHASSAAEKRGEDLLQAALSADRELAARAVREAVHNFKRWATEFGCGSRILVVGHSPYLEFLPLGLFRTVLPSLKECRGFRIVRNDDSFRLDEENGSFELNADSSDLDPSALRSSLSL